MDASTTQIDSIEDLEAALSECLVLFKARLSEIKNAGKRTMKYAELRQLGANGLVKRFTDKFNYESVGVFNGSDFSKTPADKAIARFNRKRDSLLKESGIRITN